MGQYWKIINIDNRESTGIIGNLGEFFWYFNNFVTYLMAPNIPCSYKSSLMPPKEKSQKTKNNSRTILLTLPTELLLTIAEDLVEDYLDLICLSLTCTTIWEVTEKIRFRSLHAKLKTRTWAGGRIILLGDYARTLPEGVLTVEDMKQLRLTEYDDDDELGTGLFEYYKFPKPKSNISLLNEERVQSNRALRNELRQYSYREVFSRWIHLDLDDFLLARTEGDRWMVRNFTKRQYVIKSNSRNLPQILYCLIGCSQDPTISMEGSDSLLYGIIEGKWAGDRVDITLASIHEKEREDSSDWEEITTRVKAMLEELAEENSHKFEF
ncbi:uncharacterized protein C8R40DRAFT_1132690 [Lentinula edodes]|uniref:uncharacterized protein n=1 Tax=Lentinula edodes TaxID=5353 RepID=UPI001E8E6A3C|nr:uncharacterized protein C8R40DRAFT_1132690 [Lentinula edodes]KAH7868920.1 hypothetical protein C8R40DRAFT_1132690 [Lentinula edodes]